MKLSHYNDVHHYENQHWWHQSKFNLITSTITSLNLKPSATILDVGCGTGQILIALKNYTNIYGIDYQKKAVAICRSKGLKNVSVGNAQKTKYPSNFFDCLIVLDVLEHVNEEQALSEFYRILKPKGFLIITVPAYQWMWSKWDEILMHQKRYTKVSLAQALKTHHFKITKLTYLYSFILLPTFVIRKVKSKFMKKYTSDLSLSSNKYTNSLLLKLSKHERNLTNYVSLPFGLSVYCVAKKAVTTKRLESKKPLQV